MLIGYARVSTADQNPAHQIDDAREKTVQQIADLFRVPRTTVYNHLTTSQPPAPRTPAPTP